MHIATMIDHQRFRDERGWFNRTVVGLVSAGVQVTRVVPEENSDDQRVSLTASIRMEPSAMPWARRSCLESVAAQLKTGGVSLIHAMGRGVWRDAVEVGARAGCPVVFDIWSAGDVRYAVKLSKSDGVSGIFASTSGLADELRRYIDPALVCTIPIGVHLSEEGKSLFGDGEQGEMGETDPQPVAVLAGSGAKLEHLYAIIDGFAGMRAEQSGCMLFADIDSSNSGKVWARAQKRGILDGFSMIPSVDLHRRLVMKADILLMPATSGRSSSFTLEAMAGLMVPVMVRDERVSQPPDKIAACLLDDPKAEDWQRVLREIVADPVKSCAIAREARNWVAREHRMSGQISDTYDAYEMVLTGGSVRLDPGRAG